MPHLPGRNGQASMLRFSLPQPASNPLSQANMQQFLWNFTAPLWQQQVVRIAIFGAITIQPRIVATSILVSPRISVTNIPINQPE